MADSFIVSLPCRLFICIRVNRKKYKSCYDDVLESLQGCRRFKEKMYKNWMNDVQDGSESCTSLEEYKKIAIFESGHRYFFIYSV